MSYVTKTRTVAVLVGAAVTAAVALASAQPSYAADDKEKCYGVAKAGKNDCQTPTSSCAGTSKMDGEKHAFILVPKGTCDKVVGGSVTPKM